MIANEASKYKQMPHTTMAKKLRMIEVLNAMEVIPFKNPKIADKKTDSIKRNNAQVLGFLAVIVSKEVINKTIKINPDIALVISINVPVHS